VSCGLRFLFSHWAPAPWPKTEAGQSLIEYALILPVAILALFAAINLLLIVGAKVTVDQASHYGATRLAQEGDADLACASALALCSGLMPPAPTCAASLDGEAVVTVTYDFTTLGGGIVGLDTVRLVGETRLPR
jgi:Flp pilus assembly protein TadG